MTIQETGKAFIQLTTFGNLTFAIVKENSIKSNATEKCSISTAVRNMFRIESDLLVAMYAARKNLDFLHHVFSCEFQPRKNLQKMHIRKNCH